MAVGQNPKGANANESAAPTTSARTEFRQAVGREFTGPTSGVSGMAVASLSLRLPALRWA